MILPRRRIIHVEASANQNEGSNSENVEASGNQNEGSNWIQSSPFKDAASANKNLSAVIRS